MRFWSGSQVGIVSLLLLTGCGDKAARSTDVRDSDSHSSPAAANSADTEAAPGSSPHRGSAGDSQAKADKSKQAKFWPGMWLFNEKGQHAIHVYSDGNASSGVPALIHFARDKDSGIRESAIRWLEAIGPEAKAAIPVLKEATKDPVPRVREAAADAIKKIGTGAKDGEARADANSETPQGSDFLERSEIIRSRLMQRHEQMKGGL
jgi:HEAT repeat protein